MFMERQFAWNNVERIAEVKAGRKNQSRMLSKYGYTAFN
jgi:hypothetical protein